MRCFAEFPDYDMYEIGSECAGVLVKLDDLIPRSPAGTVVHLVSDDVTAEIELIAWSDRTAPLVETRERREPVPLHRQEGRVSPPGPSLPLTQPPFIL